MASANSFLFRLSQEGPLLERARKAVYVVAVFFLYIVFGLLVLLTVEHPKSVGLCEL